MKRNVLQFIFSLICIIAAAGVTSCSSSYCAAVNGTGNSSALRSSGAKKAKCSGVSSTGTIKPKPKKRIENGLWSKDMKKSMAKKQKTKKVSKKGLSY